MRIRKRNLFLSIYENVSKVSPGQTALGAGSASDFRAIQRDVV